MVRVSRFARMRCRASGTHTGTETAHQASPAPAPAKPRSAVPADTQTGSDAGDSGDDGSTARPVTHTVVFQYNGKTFYTVEVESGRRVEKPTLQPAPSGAWKFDFSKPITGNTTIQWE